MKNKTNKTLLGITFLFVALSLTTGCTTATEDCFDVELPYQSFMEVTKDFNPYKEVDTVVFVNSMGKEYKFKRELSFSNKRTNIQTADCSEGSKTITYTSDYSVHSYIGPDSTKFAFAYFVDFKENETQFKESTMFDLLGISIYDASQVSNLLLSRLTFITSNRGGEVDADSENKNHSIRKESTTILGRKFNNVIEQKDPNNHRIIFNQEFGLVYITNLQGEELVFDRFIK